MVPSLKTESLVVVQRWAADSPKRILIVFVERLVCPKQTVWAAQPSPTVGLMLVVGIPSLLYQLGLTLVVEGPFCPTLLPG